MSVHDEIDKAISAHGMWKQKLRNAIDTGECESTPAKVKMDNNCAFGKWLYERISDNGEVTLELNRLWTLSKQGDLNLVCWCASDA